MALNQFSGQTYDCTGSQAIQVPVDVGGGAVVNKPYCPLTTGSQIIASFGLHPGLRWPDVAVMFGLFATFVALMLVGLRFLRPIKR